MKLLHISDCHLGGWRNEKINEISFNAFKEAIDISIRNKVDGILITGDLFDVPLPSLKIIINTIKKLREARKKGIKIYLIAGSHDISLSDFGAINLLEVSDIAKNVDFTKNEDINYFIDDDLFVIGISGKRKSKEIEDVKKLKEFLEKNKDKFMNKKKILLIHSAIEELTDLKIDRIKISELPNYFDYYGFGHIHENKILKRDGKIFAYPGPTFPNNFDEMEKLKGGYALLVDLENKNIEIKRLNNYEIISMKICADEKNPFYLTNEIIEKINDFDLKNKILCLRIEGVLKEGSVGQIDFSKINDIVEKKGGILLRNTSKLHSKQFEVEKLDIKLESNLEKIEEDFFNKFKNKDLIKNLIFLLDKEKNEGETNFIFEERLLKSIKNEEEKLINLLK
ncbi:MAG: DNA repair exonuclease [Candidatus Pacearchaeota archaeon]